MEGIYYKPSTYCLLYKFYLVVTWMALALGLRLQPNFQKKKKQTKKLELSKGLTIAPLQCHQRRNIKCVENENLPRDITPRVMDPLPLFLYTWYIQSLSMFILTFNLLGSEKSVMKIFKNGKIWKPVMKIFKNGKIWKPSKDITP